MSDLMLVVIPEGCGHFKCVSCGESADKLIIPVETCGMLNDQFKENLVIPVCMLHAADHLNI